MERNHGVEEPSMPAKFTDARDELNLAEFPLCALAHRLRPEQKTLHFEDRIFDERRGEMITRQLTITGSDAYGLPTALDDEILLGLIQISKLHQFEERSVRFSRYQLIQILGWRDESKSYSRIEASLNRWTGVTLYYRNAWWNKARQRWVDEKFHILDNVRLFRPEPGRTGLDSEDTGSLFIWNDVVFRSFQAGNLKSIDFDFFRELRTAIAKRLYRFLDKRFFHRKRWEFDLKEFAWEHTGLSRNYDCGNLKRKLAPGILELEQRGYLRSMPISERFRKVRGGEWRVVFEKSSSGKSSNSKTDEPTPAPLITALLQRGVSASTARQVVRQFPSDQIRTQLEVFDYLLAAKDSKVSRNPPGFLVSSIRGEYLPPKQYTDHELARRRAEEVATLRLRTERRRQVDEMAAKAQEQVRDEAIRRFWDLLSPDERMEAEQKAMALATLGQRKMLNQGGKLAETTRRVLLDSYAERFLAQNDHAFQKANPNFVKDFETPQASQANAEVDHGIYPATTGVARTELEVPHSRAR